MSLLWVQFIQTEVFASFPHLTSPSPCPRIIIRIPGVIPHGKETSRFKFPLKIEKRGFAPFLMTDITLLFCLSFAELRRLDLKCLFIACFKRELVFAGRGQLFLFLQGIIIVMAQADRTGAYQT